MISKKSSTLYWKINYHSHYKMLTEICPGKLLHVVIDTCMLLQEKIISLTFNVSYMFILFCIS